jgi:hypothetical protein
MFEYLFAIPVIINEYDFLVEVIKLVGYDSGTL